MLEQKNSRENKQTNKVRETEATKSRTKRINNNTDTWNKQKQLVSRGKEKIVF